jgi:DNA-binding NarL/FixJ family response regulator
VTKTPIPKAMRQTTHSLRSLRVVIADDHRLMAAAVRRVLSERNNIEIVGEVARGDEAVSLVLATRPDVVLLDIGLPGIDGIECAQRIREQLPDLRILMLTAYGDPESVEAAERAGADGYILKSVAAVDLVEMLDWDRSDEFMLAGFPDVDSGDVQLTDRERAVLAAVAEGLSNRQIGRQLWITEQTVKFHLKNVFRKLGASNRVDVVKRARERGLLWSGERRAAVSS